MIKYSLGRKQIFSPNLKSAANTKFLTGRSPNFSLDRQDKSWTPICQNKVDRLLAVIEK
jgi:hypothetical protein